MSVGGRASAGTGASAGATVLDRIVAETRQELVRRKRELPLERLMAEAGPDDGRERRDAGEMPDAPERRGAGTDRSDAGVAGVAGGRFHRALCRDGIGVIAEFKRRSPSAGSLHERPELARIVAAYERGGAVAASILTEGPNFEGALEDLRAARAACSLPLLRKDFIVDPYQLHEARAAGADAVLLIVAALGDAELAELHAAARALGLDVLVEVHDEAELGRALAAGASIVGVNNRDLRDFSVDVARTERLMDAMPAGVTVVSESGIGSARQLRALHARGVAAVLVGEKLMRATDPAAALRSLTASAAEADQSLSPAMPAAPAEAHQPPPPPARAEAPIRHADDEI